MHMYVHDILLQEYIKGDSVTVQGLASRRQLSRTFRLPRIMHRPMCGIGRVLDSRSAQRNTWHSFTNGNHPLKDHFDFCLQVSQLGKVARATDYIC
jgi:hypothetical protein